MKRLKLIKKNIIINPLKYTVAFLVGLVFASTAVYAWQAVWHGTDWIQSGQVIRAKEIGENMQYLYEQIEDLKSQITNLQTTINNNATTTTSIDCPGRYPGWPDVIRCETSTNYSYYIEISKFDRAHNFVYYTSIGDSSYYVLYYLNGSVRYNNNITGDCKSLTIQQLKAMGRTYNVCMKPSQ